MIIPYFGDAYLKCACYPSRSIHIARKRRRQRKFSLMFQFFFLIYCTCSLIFSLSRSLSLCVRVPLTVINLKNVSLLFKLYCSPVNVVVLRLLWTNRFDCWNAYTSKKGKKNTVNPMERIMKLSLRKILPKNIQFE